MADVFTSAPIHETPAELQREPLVANQRSIGWISDAIAGVAEGKTPWWWWAAFVPSVILLVTCFSLIAYLISAGTGVWGKFLELLHAARPGLRRVETWGSPFVRWLRLSLPASPAPSPR